MRTRVCDQFGIDVPIFAFSHCRDVVAAVSRAGGFGVLGAIGFSPEQLEIELRWIDEHVGGKPYGVDIVMPATSAIPDGVKLDQDSLERMLPEPQKKFVAEMLERYAVPPLPEGTPPPAAGLLEWASGATRSQVDVALEHPIKLLVNALGPPPKDVVDRAHACGIPVAALVGSPKHAIEQVQAGVDLIIASGTEAGGHTGEVGTMVLVPDVVDAVAPVPVLAAGGIGSGRQVAAALALGAEGVWTGSIWLTVAESDTHPVVVEKLLAAGSRDTVRSRAMTGKPARLLRTAWTEAWDGPQSPGPLPMPLQFVLTADATARIHHFARKPGSRAAELLGFPVGQVVSRMNQVKASHEVIFELVDEFVDSVKRLEGLLERAEK
ncbi:MAG: nitronate monooxygenase [Deltaproteobacteria bacterium]|nr:nitronate monooxygenase [Deltaproteobacteria bacterium]